MSNLVSTQEGDTIDIDAYLDSLGLNDEIKPDTPEEIFLRDLTGAGTYKKIFVIGDWLRIQLELFTFLNTQKVRPTTKKYKINIDDEEISYLSIQEYSTYLIQFYLQTYHLPRFYALPNRLPCEMKKTVEIIMSHPQIKGTINKFIHLKG